MRGVMAQQVLDVAIMRQFLDQIVKGTKNTEYRTMSDYWMRRLVDVSKYGEGLDEVELREAITKDKNIKYQSFTAICFHCGQRKLTKKIKEIRVYPCHNWFAIKLGDIIPDTAR